MAEAHDSGIQVEPPTLAERGFLTYLGRYTKPGGWVEFQDWDVNVYSEDDSIKGTSVEKYYSVVCGSFTKAGFIISPGPHLGEWLQEAGFEEIHVQKYRAPVGGWPKDKYYVCGLYVDLG